jgi:hypothetical protein
MKVVSYLKTVPSKNNNPQKTMLLEKFVEGVIRAGDKGVIHPGLDTVDCDVGMIQGWVHQDFRTTHLALRNRVIEQQKLKNKFTATADANLFLYNNKNNPHGYLRYSFNGIFPNTGIYCDNQVNPLRWKQIQQDTGINLLDSKQRGAWIVIMLQRNGGWSMEGQDVQQWALQTIKKIRQYSDRTIIIRPHPGDKNASTYLQPHKTLIKNMPNVKISPQGRPLEEDLHKAWAVVNHNSSAIVGPVIQGCHAFITDPKTSQCAEVAHHSFEHIENPKEFDRQRWLERISMFHWKFSELEDGSCWRHMRNYCQ